MNLASVPDLAGRRVLVPGGTGTVGRGVVRRFLAAGADVVVPTRTQDRADQFRAVLGDQASERLHLVVHDYTTFAGAEDLAAQMVANLGGIDAVVAPIGGWWAGKKLWEIDQSDWDSAFVGLATAHLAVARACLPRMTATGAYTVVVGDSADWPVPGSGLVSMEQAAVAMMLRVLEAELEGRTRVFTFVLGPVSASEGAADAALTAEGIGDAAVAALHNESTAGGRVALHDAREVAAAITRLSAV